MLEKDILKAALLNIVDQLDANNSKVSSEDCLRFAEYANAITNTTNKYSKYQACKYLGISRATFDNWVKIGKLPKGRKEQGFKEKFWILEDLKNVKS